MGLLENSASVVTARKFSNTYPCFLCSPLRLRRLVAPPDGECRRLHPAVAAVAANERARPASDSVATVRCKRVGPRLLTLRSALVSREPALRRNAPRAAQPERADWSEIAARVLSLSERRLLQ